MSASPYFDRAELRSRLTADAVSRDNGYVAIVTRIERGDVRRRPVQVLNTGNDAGPAGVFPTFAKALDYATRWLEGYVARCERVADLRMRRGVELGERLVDSRETLRGLESEKARIAGQIKAEKERASRLLDEAQHPDVELYFPPGADAWRLFDAPSETDGTLASMSRQLVITETGEVSPAPVQVEDRSKGKPWVTSEDLERAKSAGFDFSSEDIERAKALSLESDYAKAVANLHASSGRRLDRLAALADLKRDAGETDESLRGRVRNLLDVQCGKAADARPGAADAEPDAPKSRRRKAPPRAVEAAKPTKKKTGKRGTRKRKTSETDSQTDAVAGAFDAPEAWGTDAPGLDPGNVQWPSTTEPPPESESEPEL